MKLNWERPWLLINTQAYLNTINKVVLIVALDIDNGTVYSVDEEGNDELECGEYKDYTTVEDAFGNFSAVVAEVDYIKNQIDKELDKRLTKKTKEKITQLTESFLAHSEIRDSFDKDGLMKSMKLGGKEYESRN